ncbi:OLC1v1031958C2 [Oldenlandia corymbosa var. corymbosa]|nr:OLC1v1031958C2 [Oldenlandia corymbosa var. corymbosa]
MDSLVIFILSFIFPTFFIIWAVVIRCFASKRSKNRPPGPTPLPIIGNLHLLDQQLHKSLAKLAKIHGPIMSLQFGQISTVVVSSSAFAKQVLQKHHLDFSSRLMPDAVRAHDHFRYSVAWLPAAGSDWRSLRRIMNSYMFSANRLDSHRRKISEKVQELIEYCRKNCETGKAVDIGQAAFTTSLNLLSDIMFSEDLTDPSTDSAKEFKDLVWNMMVEASRPNVVDFFPVLKTFDPQGVRRRMTSHFGRVLEMFRGLISDRLTMVKNKECAGSKRMDVLDDLLDLCKESPMEIDRNLIEHLFLDLFIAGTDTTSSTLEWAMAELLKNPSTLKTAQAEIKEAIGGRGKQIEETNLPHLPYLQCIVKETLRMHPPVPIIPRKVDSDVEVCGYVVPAGSQVLVNAWAVGRDESVWEDALVFKPERSMECDSFIIRPDRDFELVPFGAGRRICPGFSLAMRIIPVALGSMINVFDWKLEDGNELKEELNMEEKFGITLRKAHPLRAIPIAI